MMCFTADEVWQFLPAVEGRPESVHVALFPSAEDVTGIPAGQTVNQSGAADVQSIRSDWETLMAVRDQVLKSLEEARQRKLIGVGLEAAVTLHAAEAVYDLLRRHESDLRAFFIVSGVQLERAAPGNGSTAIKIGVARAPGRKCERCWNYSVQ